MKKFRHYKNGNLYQPVDTCKIQENGIWILGIIYKQVGEDMLFVRSLAEFNCKFEEIGDGR
jgi:hypothetical protein